MCVFIFVFFVVFKCCFHSPLCSLSPEAELRVGDHGRRPGGRRWAGSRQSGRRGLAGAMRRSGDAAASLPAAGGKDPRAAGREGEERESEGGREGGKFLRGSPQSAEASPSKLCVQENFIGTLLERASRGAEACLFPVADDAVSP